MKYQAEKIPPKVKGNKFLLFTRYCEKCLSAFWWQKVPTDNGWPICPDCRTHLYLGLTNDMRIKK